MPGDMSSIQRHQRPAKQLLVRFEANDQNEPNMLDSARRANVCYALDLEDQAFYSTAWIKHVVRVTQ